MLRYRSSLQVQVAGQINFHNNRHMGSPNNASDLPPIRPLLAPKHWPSWLLVGIMWLLSRLPFSWGMALSRGLKPLAKVLMKSRIAISERNIRACFPSLNDAEVADMLEKNFTGLALMVGETAYAWWGNKAFFERVGKINGLEHIEAAKAAGRGVILITIHTTCMEIGGHILGTQLPITAFYRPYDNPVLERVSRKVRQKEQGAVIDKRNIRMAIKMLRSNGVLWYTTDLDVKNRKSLFIPFFGVLASTVAAPARMAKITNAVVIPMVPIREPGNRYRVEILSPLENFPTDDIEADLTRINATNEQMVMMAPDQYWWIHRRFKSRPPGEPPFYAA